MIDVSSPIDFPELYEEAYSYDGGHLNDLGAKLFTKAIFEGY